MSSNETLKIETVKSLTDNNSEYIKKIFDVLMELTDRVEKLEKKK